MARRTRHGLPSGLGQLWPPGDPQENEYRCNQISADGEACLEYQRLTIWLHKIGEIGVSEPWLVQATGSEGEIHWGRKFSSRHAAIMAILIARGHLPRDWTS